MTYTEHKSAKLWMPGEWENHSATQLHWPSNQDTWPGPRLERVEQVYLKIIEALSRFEPVILFVENEDVQKRVIRLLDEHQIETTSITMILYPINDVWARDCGPVFVRRGDDFVITDWEYNAWGEKYPPWEMCIRDRFDVKLN